MSSECILSTASIRGKVCKIGKKKTFVAFLKFPKFPHPFPNCLFRLLIALNSHPTHSPILLDVQAQCRLLQRAGWPGVRGGCKGVNHCRRNHWRCREERTEHPTAGPSWGKNQDRRKKTGKEGIREIYIMSAPNYEKIQQEGLPIQNPPPYSEKESYGDPLNLSTGPGPAYGTSPPYVPNYGQPGTGPGQGPILQQPQTVFITHAQPTNEPDYLGYSIFTMLCCCLPLGIAALVYSIQTREANLVGNADSAKRNSRMARIFAHTALGVGLGLLILYIILVVFAVLPVN